MNRNNPTYQPRPSNVVYLHPSKVTARNITMIPRSALETVYLERERTRDLAIGMAFMAGGLLGGVFTVLLAGWLL